MKEVGLGFIFLLIGAANSVLSKVSFQYDGCFLPQVKNGALTDPNGELYNLQLASFGTNLRIACDPNFVVSGNATFTCDSATADWLPTPGDCQPGHRQLSYAEDVHSQVADLWTNATVAYKISHDFPVSLVKRLEKAMQSIQDNTCLQFVNREHAGYVFFKADKTNRCTSTFGKAPEDKQTVELANSCFNETNQLYFALFTTTGLVQEHRRPDRDDYIEILWDNIDERAKHVFEKYDVIDERIAKMPYDTTSVMHFGASEYAKAPGLVTIRSRNNPALKSFGGQVPSDLDYKKISALYCQQSASSLPMTTLSSTTVAPSSTIIVTSTVNSTIDNSSTVVPTTITTSGTTMVPLSTTAEPESTTVVSPAGLNATGSIIGELFPYEEVDLFNETISFNNITEVATNRTEISP